MPDQPWSISIHTPTSLDDWRRSQAEAFERDRQIRERAQNLPRFDRPAALSPSDGERYGSRDRFAQTSEWEYWRRFGTMPTGQLSQQDRENQLANAARSAAAQRRFVPPPAQPDNSHQIQRIAERAMETLHQAVGRGEITREYAAEMAEGYAHMASSNVPAHKAQEVFDTLQRRYRLDAERRDMQLAQRVGISNLPATINQLVNRSEPRTTVKDAIGRYEDALAELHAEVQQHTRLREQYNDLSRFGESYDIERNRQWPSLSAYGQRVRAAAEKAEQARFNILNSGHYADIPEVYRTHTSRVMRDEMGYQDERGMMPPPPPSAMPRPALQGTTPIHGSLRQEDHMARMLREVAKGRDPEAVAYLMDPETRALFDQYVKLPDTGGRNLVGIAQLTTLTQRIRRLSPAAVAQSYFGTESFSEARDVASWTRGGWDPRSESVEQQGLYSGMLGTMRSNFGGIPTDEQIDAIRALTQRMDPLYRAHRPSALTMGGIHSAGEVDLAAELGLGEEGGPSGYQSYSSLRAMTAYHSRGEGGMDDLATQLRLSELAEAARNPAHLFQRRVETMNRRTMQPLAHPVVTSAGLPVNLSGEFSGANPLSLAERQAADFGVSDLYAGSGPGSNLPERQVPVPGTEEFPDPFTNAIHTSMYEKALRAHGGLLDNMRTARRRYAASRLGTLLNQAGRPQGSESLSFPVNFASSHRTLVRGNIAAGLADEEFMHGFTPTPKEVKAGAPDLAWDELRLLTPPGRRLTTPGRWDIEPEEGQEGFLRHYHPQSDMPAMLGHESPSGGPPDYPKDSEPFDSSQPLSITRGYIDAMRREMESARQMGRTPRYGDANPRAIATLEFLLKGGDLSQKMGVPERPGATQLQLGTEAGGPALGEELINARNPDLLFNLARGKQNIDRFSGGQSIAGPLQPFMEGITIARRMQSALANPSRGNAGGIELDNGEHMGLEQFMRHARAMRDRISDPAAKARWNGLYRRSAIAYDNLFGHGSGANINQMGIALQAIRGAFGHDAPPLYGPGMEQLQAVGTLLGKPFSAAPSRGQASPEAWLDRIEALQGVTGKIIGSGQVNAEDVFPFLGQIGLTDPEFSQFIASHPARRILPEAGLNSIDVRTLHAFNGIGWATPPGATVQVEHNGELVSAAAHPLGKTSPANMNVPMSWWNLNSMAHGDASHWLYNHLSRILPGQAISAIKLIQGMKNYGRPIISDKQRANPSTPDWGKFGMLGVGREVLHRYTTAGGESFNAPISARPWNPEMLTGIAGGDIPALTPEEQETLRRLQAGGDTSPGDITSLSHPPDIRAQFDAAGWLNDFHAGMRPNHLDIKYGRPDRKAIAQEATRRHNAGKDGQAPPPPPPGASFRPDDAYNPFDNDPTTWASDYLQYGYADATMQQRWHAMNPEQRQRATADVERLSQQGHTRANATAHTRQTSQSGNAPDPAVVAAAAAQAAANPNVANAAAAGAAAAAAANRGAGTGGGASGAAPPGGGHAGSAPPPPFGGGNIPPGGFNGAGGPAGMPPGTPPNAPVYSGNRPYGKNGYYGRGFGPLNAPATISEWLDDARYRAQSPLAQTSRTLARTGWELSFTGNYLNQFNQQALTEAENYRLAEAGTAMAAGQYPGAHRQPLSGSPVEQSLLAQYPMFSATQQMQAQNAIATQLGLTGRAATPKGQYDSRIIQHVLNASAVGNIDPQQLVEALGSLTGQTGGSNLSGMATNYLGSMVSLANGNLNQMNLQPITQALGSIIPWSSLGGEGGTLAGVSLLQSGVNAGISPQGLPQLAQGYGSLYQAGYSPNVNQGLALLQLQSGQQFSRTGTTNGLPSIIPQMAGALKSTGLNVPDTARFMQTMLGQQSNIVSAQNAIQFNVPNLQIQATNAQINLQQAQLGQAQTQLQEGYASYGFNLWKMNQEYGPIGADVSRSAYFDFMKSQLAAGYDPTQADSAGKFAPQTPFGIQNEQFYAGIEHQRSELVLGRSKLTSDAAFQENLKYLNLQEAFYKQQLNVTNAERSFNEVWQKKLLDSQAAVVAAQGKSVAIQEKLELAQIPVLQYQAKLLPLQLQAMQAELSGEINQALGYGAGANGQPISATQTMQNLVSAFKNGQDVQPFLNALTQGNAGEMAQLMTVIKYEAQHGTQGNQAMQEQIAQALATIQSDQAHMQGEGAFGAQTVQAATANAILNTLSDPSIARQLQDNLKGTIDAFGKMAPLLGIIDLALGPIAVALSIIGPLMVGAGGIGNLLSMLAGLGPAAAGTVAGGVGGAAAGAAAGGAIPFIARAFTPMAGNGPNGPWVSSIPNAATRAWNGITGSAGAAAEWATAAPDLTSVGTAMGSGTGLATVAGVTAGAWAAPFLPLGVLSASRGNGFFTPLASGTGAFLNGLAGLIAGPLALADKHFGGGSDDTLQQFARWTMTNYQNQETTFNHSFGGDAWTAGLYGNGGGAGSPDTTDPKTLFNPQANAINQVMNGAVNVKTYRVLAQSAAAGFASDMQTALDNKILTYRKPVQVTDAAIKASADSMAAGLDNAWQKSAAKHQLGIDKLLNVTDPKPYDTTAAHIDTELTNSLLKKDVPRHLGVILGDGVTSGISDTVNGFSWQNMGLQIGNLVKSGLGGSIGSGFEYQITQGFTNAWNWIATVIQQNAGFFQQMGMSPGQAAHWIRGQMMSGYAEGGVITGNRPVVMNERGPEVVKLPSGSVVIPAGQSAGMLAHVGSSASSKTVNVNINVNGTVKATLQTNDRDEIIAQALDALRTALQD